LGSIDSWLKFKGPIPQQQGPTSVEFEPKNPEIPKLANYNSVPGDEFWASFPKNKGELKVESAVSVSSLKRHVAACSKYLSMPEKMRANRAIMSLVKGAPAAQKGPLPSCSVKHAHSTYKHGFVMTDTIAEWVKQGYVAGPYDTPLLRIFAQTVC
jgi:hypothetical protein